MYLPCASWSCVANSRNYRSCPSTWRALRVFGFGIRSRCSIREYALSDRLVLLKKEKKHQVVFQLLFSICTRIEYLFRSSVLASRFDICRCSQFQKARARMSILFCTHVSCTGRYYLNWIILRNLISEIYILLQGYAEGMNMRAEMCRRFVQQDELKSSTAYYHNFTTNAHN